MEETIKLYREELYEQVWSIPMTKLAKQYQISDVGLAKICKKLKIPVPGRGYWAKKGKKKRPPLLLIKGVPEFAVHRIFPENPNLEKEQNKEENDEIQVLVAFEENPENYIKVPEKLYSPHPLVAFTKQCLRTGHSDTYGHVRIVHNKCLDTRITKGNIDRAMRIYIALIKALEPRGFSVSINESNGTTIVSVLGEILKIRLEEPTTKVERELTQEEKKKLLQNGWLYDRYRYVPSGKLVFKIDEYIDGIRKSWSDGKKHQLEDLLNSFIIGLIRAAEKEKIKRLEREQREREWREQEEERRRKAEKIQKEKERLERLLREAEAWQKAQQIRTYIEAVKQAAIQKYGFINTGSELDNWLKWTTQQVDRLDPLAESPLSILDE
jgi:hypothetical protein